MINQRDYKARVLAYYLPQFHPTIENDEWWGAGFTEWRNVVKARPLFPGHVQPHLPGTLGFYDLRVPETRQAQADLAQQFGVEAFCYWHYWFAGRRILERPFEEMLASGEPNHSFCLAWANQTWAGTWHGADRRILIEQTYPGPEDDKAHFAHILPAFRDPRYFRVNGKPLFYIFCPQDLPDPKAFAQRWRDMAEKAGLGGIYLVAEMSDLTGSGPKAQTPDVYGFDAAVYVRLPAEITPFSRFKMRCGRRLLKWPEIYNYSDTLPPLPANLSSRNDIFPCVYPNWDHSPRTGRRGVVVNGAHPEKFGRHMREAVSRLNSKPAQEQLLFVKSWNEWAEGNYLEPDLEFGNSFLQALCQEIQI